MPTSKYTVAFHELAEAYEKIDSLPLRKINSAGSPKRHVKRPMISRASIQMPRSR